MTCERLHTKTILWTISPLGSSVPLIARLKQISGLQKFSISPGSNYRALRMMSGGQLTPEPFDWGPDVGSEVVEE